MGTLPLLLLMVMLAGCGRDMKDQPRYEPQEPSVFFADHRGDRPAVPNTVPRGYLREDELMYTGRVDGKLANLFPFPVTREVLERGRDRYRIYCTACHDGLGTGKGMVIRRGFKPLPPSFHEVRLREAPAGHYYEVMTKGFGAMADYSAQIEPWDRWAIAAYIRALQLSRNASIQDLPASDQSVLTGKAS